MFTKFKNALQVFNETCIHGLMHQQQQQHHATDMYRLGLIDIHLPMFWHVFDFGIWE